VARKEFISLESLREEMGEDEVETSFKYNFH
jgi:hypothetical protein